MRCLELQYILSQSANDYSVQNQLARVTVPAVDSNTGRTARNGDGLRGLRIAEVSGEIREGSFLFQRLSLLIQRFNEFCFMTALLMRWQVIPANFVVFCNRSNFWMLPRVK